MPYPPPPDEPIPPLDPVTPVTQVDLENVLTPAEKNIMRFMPPPPPGPPLPPEPPEVPVQINAAAVKTAQQLAAALFPFIQTMATQIANQVIDERLSAQLQQLQTDVNTIKTQLGIM